MGIRKKKQALSNKDASGLRQCVDRIGVNFALSKIDTCWDQFDGQTYSPEEKETSSAFIGSQVGLRKKKKLKMAF